MTRKIKNITIIRTPREPAQGTDEFGAPPIPPLGLAKITAVLRTNGYIVKQDDLNIKIAHNHFSKVNKIDLSGIYNDNKIISYLKDKTDYYDYLVSQILSLTNVNDTDLFMFGTPNSITSPSSIRMLLIISKFIKKKYGKPIIVGGAPMIRYLAEWSFENQIFDYFISGPAEHSVLKLVDCLNSGRTIDAIDGLCYLKDNKLVQNDMGLHDLEIIPDFGGLPMDLYRWPPKSRRILIMPYKFNYGCPNECAFCNASVYNQIEFQDYRKAVDNILRLSRKYNTKHFIFYSDYFNVSKKYAMNFCNELIRRKADIMWSDCAYEKNLDTELLSLMKKSGCARLVLGCETASPRLLKHINKRLSLSHLAEVLKISDSLGIWNGIDIIMGLPTENETDVQATINFIDSNIKNIDEIYYPKFRVRMTSQIYRNPKKYGIRNLKFRYGEDFIKKSNYFASTGGRYDEIELSWNDKKKNMTKSVHRLEQLFPNQTRLLENEQLNLIFYLFNRYHDKKRVKVEYLKYLKKHQMRLLTNPKWLFWKAKKRAKEIILNNYGF